jgi:Predicted Zn-dependent hydrolases of the beta-lactamase fold
MEVTYYGQNCIELRLSSVTLLVDPATSVNPLAQKIKKEDLKAEYILVTHAHQDHCADVSYIANKNDSIVIANYEIASHYGRLGHKYHPMNHGGKWTFDFGTIAMTAAIHTSSFADGSYGGQPAGFVIQAEGKTIYIAGDTALTYDMKTIPRLYGPVDLSILPIGDNFTMGIEEAIIAAEFVECDNILGCHYDTFPYIEINQKDAIEKFTSAGLRLNLLDIGDTMVI